MVFELLQLPFVQRALIAGVILGILYAILGVYVILRNMAFWGDGLAHASLAGIAIALLAGWQPLLWAIIVAVIFAVGIYYLEKKTSLSNDALIGVLFTSFMALGIIILNFIEGYQPELISFLFGNILTVTTVDLIIMVTVSIVVIVFLQYFRRQLSLLTFDQESAYIAGVPVHALDLIFYIILAVSVVLGVKLLGVVLVSALLIIPASTAKMLAGSYAELQKISIIISLSVVLIGMLISLAYDLPSGPSIILVGASVFIFVTILKINQVIK